MPRLAGRFGVWADAHDAQFWGFEGVWGIWGVATCSPAENPVGFLLIGKTAGFVLEIY